MLKKLDIDYLDIESLNPDNVVNYEAWKYDKHFKHTSLHQTQGMLNSNKTKYHVYCGFNKFTKFGCPIPPKDQGWKNMYDIILENYEKLRKEGDLKLTQEEFTKECLENHIENVKSMCNPSAVIFVPPEIHPLKKHTNCKMYKTPDCSRVGFIVLIGQSLDDNDYENKKNRVFIYGRTTDFIDYNNNSDDIFVNLIKVYDPIEIFIGESTFNELTKINRTYGEKWNGNTLLLRINDNESNEFKYVSISDDVIEFVIDEKIINFVSNVGEYYMPYPYAESLNWCYCFCKYEKSPITDHKNRKTIGHILHKEDIGYQKFETLHIAENNAELNRFGSSIYDSYIWGFLREVLR